MVNEAAVEEHLIGVLQLGQEHVLLDGSLLGVEHIHHSLHLPIAMRFIGLLRRKRDEEEKLT